MSQRGGKVFSRVQSCDVKVTEGCLVSTLRTKSREGTVQDTGADVRPKWVYEHVHLGVLCHLWCIIVLYSQYYVRVT